MFSCEYSKCFKNTCFKKTSVNDCFWFLLLWFSCTWPIPGTLFLCVRTINDFYFHSGTHTFKQPSRHTTSYRRWNDVVCLLGIHFQWNKNSKWSCQTKQEVLKHFSIWSTIPGVSLVISKIFGGISQNSTGWLIPMLLNTAGWGFIKKETLLKKNFSAKFAKFLRKLFHRTPLCDYFSNSNSNYFESFRKHRNIWQ